MHQAEVGGGAVGRDLAGPSGAGHRQTIKLKPLEAPVFDGKAKSYARFKQRFEEMISASYDTMGQLEFLESALPAKIKGRMSLVSKTPKQIWEQA